MKFNKIKHCRLCKSSKLKPIINFGSISLSTKFPKKKTEYKKKNAYDFWNMQKL